MPPKPAKPTHDYYAVSLPDQARSANLVARLRALIEIEKGVPVRGNGAVLVAIEEALARREAVEKPDP